MSAWNGVYNDGSLLCPECDEATPSTEVFEVFGLMLCAECAADLFDPGDGHPAPINQQPEEGS